MVERPLSMREAGGSIPPSSRLFIFLIFNSKEELILPHYELIIQSLVHYLQYLNVVLYATLYSLIVDLLFAVNHFCLIFVTLLDVSIKLLQILFKGFCNYVTSTLALL